MKAVISSTYSDQYLFFLPIVTWCWNKLGVGVSLFVPKTVNEKEKDKLQLGLNSGNFGYTENDFHYFESPKHKEATYAQCSRLYAAALDLPEDEVLITSDIDMVVFKLPLITDEFTIIGYDLVPNGQYPICYAAGTKAQWEWIFNTNGNSVQHCLDEELEDIECENFRGNYWSKDQELLFNHTQKANKTLIARAKPGTQFAEHRVDRDDINWRSYVNDSLIDAHLWRPGYTDENFANIMELLQMKYPEENFQWLIDYRTEYLKLL